MQRCCNILVIEGEGWNKLAQLLVDVMQPDNDEREQKLLTTPLRTPLIIVAVATFKVRPVPEHKLSDYVQRWPA